MLATPPAAARCMAGQVFTVVPLPTEPLLLHSLEGLSGGKVTVCDTEDICSWGSLLSEMGFHQPRSRV